MTENTNPPARVSMLKFINNAIGKGELRRFGAVFGHNIEQHAPKGVNPKAWADSLRACVHGQNEAAVRRWLKVNDTELALRLTLPPTEEVADFLAGVVDALIKAEEIREVSKVAR